MTTESFPQFINRIEQTPPTDQSRIPQLVFEAKQGGRRAAVARMQLRAIPGGTEALIASTYQGPQPVAPRDATPLVSAPAPPAPVPTPPPPPPPSDPSLFDKTLGRGIGALGRGVLGVGRFVQPATDPLLENLGKGIETGVGTAVSTAAGLTPGDFMGLESNLAEERAKRGIEPRLPSFLQLTPLGGLDALLRGDIAKELQAQAAAWRATDMPSTRLNVLPGQGVPLPGGKRLDEIDFGVKGAFELLPELALGIATGGTSAAGGIGRRAATSAANVLGADIAMGAGRAATKGVKAVMPSRSAAKQADAAPRGVVDLNEKLALDSATPKLFEQDQLNMHSPQGRIYTGEEVPRYWYHRPPARVPVSASDRTSLKINSRPKDGGLNAYILKEQEAKAIFGDVNVKGIWLSPTKDYGESSVLVDLTKLDNSNMLIETSGLVHRGDIPKAAVVDPPTTPATGTAAARGVGDAPLQINLSRGFAGNAESLADDIKALGEPNPLNPNEVVIDGVAVGPISVFDGNLRLNSLRSLEPGTGAGTRVLERITELADEAGVTIEGAAVPTRGAGGVTVPEARLRAFYERHGFVFDDPNDPQKMVRTPTSEAPTTPVRQADVVADVEPQQLSFDFIDDPDISPTTGKVSAADEAFEVNQTKVVELPEGYSPGLIEDLVPKIISPNVVRRSIEKTKKLLKAIPGVGGAQLRPSTLPGMAVSAVIKAAPARIGSASNRLAQDVRGQLTKRDADGNRVFEFSNDDMRIENIADKVAGDNPRTGKLLDPNPTVADLAQDYGAYKPFLTPDQIEVMDSLRVRAEGLAADLEQFGFEVEYKAQLGDGGFFISRGPTKQEVEARVQGTKRAAKESYEKVRATDVNGIPFTQSELIANGSEYLPVWDEFGQWSTEIYEAILDKQIGKFVREYVDPVTGERIALTTGELAGDLSIDAQRLRAEIAAARRTLARQEVRLSEKQKQYVRDFGKFETYTDKLSELRTKLAAAITDKELQNLISKEYKAKQRLLINAEKVLGTRQARSKIAEMRSGDLQEQLNNIENFEKYENELLANAAQRLEAQQLGGSSQDVINRSQRQVNDLQASANRARVLRERAEGILDTARKREEAADIAEGAAEVDVRLTRRDLEEAEIPVDADADFKKAQLELRQFSKEVTDRKKTMTGSGKRLETEKEKVAKSQLKIINLQKKLDELKPKIDEAVRKASEGKDRSNLQYRSLNGNVWMNADDLETIRRSQEGMEATRGRAAKVIGPLSTYQSIRRAVGATLDDSGISIQGKLRQFSNPKQYYRAWKDHLQSLIGKPGRKGNRLQREAMSDNLRKFDEQSQSWGAPSSHEIIDRMGIRFGGVDTEVTLRPEGITGTIGRLPLIRRANEAFGAFGDMLRLRDARKEILEYMRLSGKTFDELVADGTARKIGNGVNGITGWTPNGVAGVYGDMLLFAPRFFRARIETLHRAIKGMDADFMIDALPFDRQIRRNLNINHGIRNSIEADQLIARRAVMKLVSTGTLITVAANEVLGQETDFQLMRNGRMNPNFMSVRLTKLGAPRDWNIFGPYKSLAALVLASGGAAWEKDLQKALDAWLNLSSPIVGDIFEFLNFRAYGESRFGETLPEYIAESHIPFALQEVPNIIKETSIGNPKDAFGGALSIGLEFVGEQSSALSRSDILQDYVGDLFRSGMVSADNYDDLEPYEKNDVKDSLVAELEKFDVDTAATGKPFKRFFATVDIINRRRDSLLQEAMVFFYAGRRSDGSEYTKRDFIDDYFDIIDDARERKEQVEETLGIEFKDKVIADDDLEAQALEAWYNATSESLTAAGSYLPDRVKLLRDKVLRDFPEQADYILRNTNDTPLPEGFLEALERAGLKSTVDRIRESDAARQARGAPPRASVPSETLVPAEQPTGTPQPVGQPTVEQPAEEDVPESVLRTRQLLAP